MGLSIWSTIELFQDLHGVYVKQRKEQKYHFNLNRVIYYF